MYSIGLFLFLIMEVTAEVTQIVDYHDHVGIPLAKWIKKREDEIQARLARSREVGGRRVAGGEVAPLNLYPYLGGLIVKIKNQDDLSACASALITANRLATAAHCWKSATHQTEQFPVVLGSKFLFTGGTRIVSTQVLVHPEYKQETLFNDIAIIYLPTYVPLSDTIKPVILPHGNQNLTYVGEWLMTAGYRRTDENIPTSDRSVINHVRLQVITNEQCHQVFEHVKPSNICTNGTGGVGVCHGDSGAPLISIKQGQKILVGIATFGHLEGCQHGYPSVFARVTSYYDFILDHL